MKNGRTFVLLFLLIIISCFSLASCGSVSKEELNKTAAGIYNGANSALTELDEEGVSIVGNYVISSNPNYNYYNGTSGIENSTYDLYQKISNYCSDSDDYEYIFEVTSGWTGVNISQVYVAEKWDSKTIGGYPTKSDSSEWPPYCMYLTNDFDTLQDIADSSGKLNAYDGSAYNFIDGTYGLDTTAGDSLFDLSSFDYYELLDEIIELFGSWTFRLFLIIFIVSLVWCLFGYQIYQVFAALSSLLVMSLVGLLASFGTDSLVAFGICFLLGVVLAIVCAKSKAFSAFMIGLMNSLPITAVISMIITQNIKNGLIIGLVLSIVIGIITAVIKKPLIILSSAIGFGSIAGTALACMIPNTKLSIVLQLVLICMGIFVQTKIAHGLLENGSVIEYFKEKRTPKLDDTENHTDNKIRKSKSKTKKTKKSEKNGCPNCGATLSKDSKFCTKCGYKISEIPVIDEAVEESSKNEDTIISPPDKLVDSAIISDEIINSPKNEEVIHESNLSLGGLGERPASSVPTGELVINVDKKTEKKSTGNSHFTSADDFDD